MKITKQQMDIVKNMTEEQIYRMNALRKYKLQKIGKNQADIAAEAAIEMKKENPFSPQYVSDALNRRITHPQAVELFITFNIILDRHFKKLKNPKSQLKFA